MAEAIVHTALLGVGEHLVGLGGLFELLDRLGRLVAVGVILQRQAAVRLLDVVFGGAPLDAQDFVVIALRRRAGHLRLNLSVSGC